MRRKRTHFAFWDNDVVFHDTSVRLHAFFVHLGQGGSVNSFTEECPAVTPDSLNSVLKEVNMFLNTFFTHLQAGKSVEAFLAEHPEFSSGLLVQLLAISESLLTHRMHKDKKKGI